jgi:hypothetical protein
VLSQTNYNALRLRTHLTTDHTCPRWPAPVHDPDRGGLGATGGRVGAAGGGVIGASSGGLGTAGGGIGASS